MKLLHCCRELSKLACFEKPEKMSLINNQILYCFYCGVDSTKLFRCVRCKSAWYCSQEHQKLHWNIHKSACAKGDRHPSNYHLTQDNSTDQLMYYGHNFRPQQQQQQNNFPQQLNNFPQQLNFQQPQQQNFQQTHSPNFVQKHSPTNFPQTQNNFAAAAQHNFVAPTTSPTQHKFPQQHSTSPNPIANNHPFNNFQPQPQQQPQQQFNYDNTSATLLNGNISLNEDNMTSLNHFDLPTPSSNMFLMTEPNSPSFADLLADDFQDSSDLYSMAAPGGDGGAKDALQMPVVLPQEEQNLPTVVPGPERAMYAYKKLYDQGFAVIDNFLEEKNAKSVFSNVLRAMESGAMKAGQVTKSNMEKSHSQSIRGDLVMWATGQETQYRDINLVIGRIDKLMAELNELIKEYVIKGRTPAMVACYPGNGTRYKHHIDNTHKDGRVITALYYLNENWNDDVDGGLIRMYPMGGERTDVSPAMNRLLLFWSDKRTPHEVLPAYRNRFALTLWYFDAAEREIVRQAYFSKIREQFSTPTNAKNSDTT